MSFLAVILVICLLNKSVLAVMAWEDEDFFSNCPPSWCSKHGPEIRFPFQLESANRSSLCGAPCMKLACSGEDTILVESALAAYKVAAIDYRRGTMTITPPVNSSSCNLIEKLNSESVRYHFYLDMYDQPNACYTFYLEKSAVVRCSRKFAPRSSTVEDIAGPIPCLSNATHFYYLVDAFADMSVLPLDCKVTSDGMIPMPNIILVSSTGYREGFREVAERIINVPEMTVSFWQSDIKTITYNCTLCESHGRRCAFSSQTNQTFCMHQGSHIKVIAATSAAAALVVLFVATTLYLSLKTRYNEEIHLKVEMFLKAYGTSKATRYTFPEVKKIARRFKEKVGQGGFGSVYKGELPNGVHVAVKMLENSIGVGEDFINEVATIGLIHHANIVRLLGFCSEGTRRALIYEFMPNESLEKYIFLPDSNSSTSQKLLVPKKMADVALGIARGMEYLHQGCNKRILHFDIKPHNILLDYNFEPKISDFGLAKLCARDQSIVTLTNARGTMGYIAPELYSRNFGGVSYKSDVYSFGMLVLEMVSGRRNSDPSVQSQNEVYLPEWIFERVITGQDLVIGREMTQEEKEKVKQLAIVGLWCIQWNPRNRPSMTKVVNMLTGQLENLKMPPKPFVSNGSHNMM